ncbi:SAM-dependent methyltransferase [Kitasatospora sp. NPDC048540]|uniref:SAM-dependent methyltransferase n=1 Tax=Kitasatospora sp. NPDC048540 TaxID=3155634 RepID=UPI0033F44440
MSEHQDGPERRDWTGELGGMVEQVGGHRPPEIETSLPHSARMYDYWLGGKTNFPADRALGEAFEQAIPSIRTMARENRAFLGRSVRYLVREAGIRQFLDIGTGIPTEGNTHEVAQAEAVDSRVVYVDNDPIVLAHARALMVSGVAGRTAYLHADLREPERILSHPALTGTLDVTRPVGLMLVAILMLLEDEDDPWGKVRKLLDALPAGSHVAITHPSADFNPEAMGQVVAAAQQGRLTLVPRTREQVAEFFGDWELIEPGVVPVMGWHPDGAPPADPQAAYYWAGVARKRS